MAPPEVAPVVKEFKYVGAGYVKGQLYDLGDFPGAKLDDQEQSKVYGKIYELPADKKALDVLDKYEEFHPRSRKKSLFVRRRTLVNRSNRKPIEAWIYEYNGRPSPARKIESGHYSKAAA